MERMMIHQIVPSFEQWHTAFQSGMEPRKAHGCTAEQIFQNPSNPNDVVILTEWKSKEQLQAFLTNPMTRETMAKANGGTLPEPFYLVPVQG